MPFSGNFLAKRKVLPLFGNDTTRQLFIGFTPFFRQISKFLNFRNEIYKEIHRVGCHWQLKL